MRKFPATFDMQRNVPLAEYTSLQVGGRADYLMEISTQDVLVELAHYCWKHHIRFFPLGSGTNVFFSDAGFQGLVGVIRFNKIECRGNILRTEAGAALDDVVQTCAARSLAGFEFAAGIPGTVGGALYGNAGAYGKAAGDQINGAKILLPEGGLREVDRDFFEFSYRNSRLKKNPGIVLEAEFAMQPGDREEISARINDILQLRRAKLPWKGIKTAGSYFKNIKDQQGRATAAATLLDAVGSKQTHVGDAGVFEKHANIFVNNGHAAARDILELESILKNRVYEKFHILLEREVMFIE